jgi:hypothetical protein
MYKAGDEDSYLIQNQAWNEPEAVELLQHAGMLVAQFESGGTQMAQREFYHARLIASHDAQDMVAYRTALNGYVEAARQASREASRKAAYHQRKRGR